MGNILKEQENVVVHTPIDIDFNVDEEVQKHI